MPGYLVGLLDVDTREESLGALWMTVCHPGTIYDSSAPAATALGLIAAVDQPEREPLLRLLAALAEGNGYLLAHGTVAG